MPESNLFSNLVQHPCFPSLASAGTHAIQLWISEIRVVNDGQQCDPRTALLFGWAYPIVPGPPPGRWYGNNVEFKAIGSEKSRLFQFRVRRLSAYVPSSTILAVTDALATGGTLAEVSSRADISALPTDLASLRSARAETNQTVVQSPIVLETTDAIRRLVEHSRPESSPVAGTLGYAATARLVDKDLLIRSRVPGDQLHNRRKLLDRCEPSTKRRYRSGIRSKRCWKNRRLRITGLSVRRCLRTVIS